MSYLNHSNYSVITIDGNGNSTLNENLNSNPYDEKLMNGLIYFGVSLHRPKRKMRQSKTYVYIL